jgi:hypothetical protein
MTLIGTHRTMWRVVWRFLFISLRGLKTHMWDFISLSGRMIVSWHALRVGNGALYAYICCKTQNTVLESIIAIHDIFCENEKLF